MSIKFLLLCCLILVYDSLPASLVYGALPAANRFGYMVRNIDDEKAEPKVLWSCKLKIESPQDFFRTIDEALKAIAKKEASITFNSNQAVLNFWNTYKDNNKLISKDLSDGVISVNAALTEAQIEISHHKNREFLMILQDISNNLGSSEGISQEIRNSREGNFLERLQTIQPWLSKTVSPPSPSDESNSGIKLVVQRNMTDVQPQDPLPLHSAWQRFKNAFYFRWKTCDKIPKQYSSTEAREFEENKFYIKSVDAVLIIAMAITGLFLFYVMFRLSNPFIKPSNERLTHLINDNILLLIK